MKMKRRTSRGKRIAKILSYTVLTLLVLFAVLSMVGMKIIYDEQFGRFERPDPAISTELRYSDVAGLYPQELVTFYSGNNRLQGYLYHNPLSPGLVVVAHGMGGGADSYLPQIMYFLDQGWSVFAYDATGSYDSEGKSSRGFPQSLVDLDAALQYTSTRPDINDLPVLIFGHSWGGYAAANILHYDHPVAGIVSIAAPNSSIEMILEQGSKMLGPIMYSQRPFLWLYERVLYGRTAALTAVDALNKTAVPALIIHGTGDTTVEYQGSSIISRRDKITNPKVQFLALDEENRNNHNNILHSRESNAYVNGLNAELRALAQQYDDGIPYEIKREFFAQIDKALVHQVNQELMEQINNFFLSCIED